MANTNCSKCEHSAFDHSDDTGCDAKGCSCPKSFENVVDEVFTRLETEIDNLYKELNTFKVINHRLRTENDNENDNALEWSASWITGAGLIGKNEEVQEYASAMAMSIRAAKRGLTKRALDVCPSCAGKGIKQIGAYSETCPACHGTGTRQ